MTNQQRKSIIVHQRWRAQTKETAAAGFINTQRLQAAEHNVFNKVPSMHLAILQVNVKNVNELNWYVELYSEHLNVIIALANYLCIHFASLWFCIAFNCIVKYCKIRIGGKFYIKSNQTKLVMCWVTQNVIASIG